MKYGMLVETVGEDSGATASGVDTVQHTRSLRLNLLISGLRPELADSPSPVPDPVVSHGLPCVAVCHPKLPMAGVAVSP